MKKAILILLMIFVTIFGWRAYFTKPISPPKNSEPHFSFKPMIDTNEHGLKIREPSIVETDTNACSFARDGLFLNKGNALEWQVNFTDRTYVFYSDNLKILSIESKGRDFPTNLNNVTIEVTQKPIVKRVGKQWRITFKKL